MQELPKAAIFDLVFTQQHQKIAAFGSSYRGSESMLNYRQLHYFWVVAKTGSIVRACEQLNLTPKPSAGRFRCSSNVWH